MASAGALAGGAAGEPRFAAPITSGAAYGRQTDSATSAAAKAKVDVSFCCVASSDGEKAAAPTKAAKVKRLKERIERRMKRVCRKNAKQQLPQQHAPAAPADDVPLQLVPAKGILAEHQAGVETLSKVSKEAIASSEPAAATAVATASAVSRPRKRAADDSVVHMTNNYHVRAALLAMDTPAQSLCDPITERSAQSSIFKSMAASQPSATAMQHSRFDSTLERLHDTTASARERSAHQRHDLNRLGVASGRLSSTLVCAPSLQRAPSGICRPRNGAGNLDLQRKSAPVVSAGTNLLNADQAAVYLSGRSSGSSMIEAPSHSTDDQDHNLAGHGPHRMHRGSTGRNVDGDLSGMGNVSSGGHEGSAGLPRADERPHGAFRRSHLSDFVQRLPGALFSRLSKLCSLFAVDEKPDESSPWS